MAESEPERLDKVDQEIRINELKERARELSGGEMVSFEAEEAPPEILEQFWQNVVDVESGPWTSSRGQIQEDGVALPAPEELSDAQLAVKLEEIFNCLATHRTYFLSTNHLSDRQLYERLLEDVLDEEVPEREASSEGVYIVDLVTSGSEEDILAYLKYYADEKARELWREDFPDEEMPSHEDPPYDRDRRLPPPPPGY